MSKNRSRYKRVATLSRLMADLAVIGHVAVDRVITHREDRTQLGGPPTFVSVVCQRLGRSVEAATKVGGDLPAEFASRLRELGIHREGVVIDDAETTRFVLDYRGTDRSLSVESVCEEIGPEDILELPEVMLLAPIVGEVPASTVSSIDADVIALDPQGFLRNIRPDGSIMPRRWFDEGLLRRLTIYKSSEEELRLITEDANTLRGLERIIRLGAEVAVATMGGEGALLVTRRGRFRVPALEISEVLDPTGAGDAFMGALFSVYMDGEEPLWCASMGAAMASCVVETLGARIDASLKQVEERAEDVYNRAVRL